MVADGFSVLAFLRSLHHSLLMGSFVSKFCSRSQSCTMCSSHADSVYIIDVIHHIRTGPLHMVTSGQITVSFFTPVQNARNQNTSKKLAHCYTQNTINSNHPSQNSQYLAYITIYNCKRYFQKFPVTHPAQNLKKIDQITSMSKSPFWCTVTHLLVPIYILQALNMRTGLNQLTMSSVPYFVPQTKAAGICFSQD